MKVAMIDPALFTWPYDVRLLQALRGLGHQIELFGKVLGQPEDGADPALVRPHFYPGLPGTPRPGWPATAHKLRKGLSHVASMRRLVRVLRQERPDVIHFQWLPLPMLDRVFLAALRQIAPILLTAHDSRPFNANPGARLQAWGAMSVLRRFDRVIVHTAQAESRLREQGVAPDRLVRIAHGLLDDLPEGLPPPAADTDKVTFLIFGKVKPYKGVDVALAALAALPEATRRQCRLQVVGRPYMDVGPLIRQAEALGIRDEVEFDFRFVPDAEMTALIRAADVLLFPYREIEVSGVLMATLALRRPIIASALGGFAEMLQDGRQALLVPATDVPALTAAMARMIQQPALRQGLADALDRLVSGIPTWPEIARQTTGAYEAALDGRGVVTGGVACQTSITANRM